MGREEFDGAGRRKKLKAGGMVRQSKAFLLYSHHLVPSPPTSADTDVYLIEDLHLLGLAGETPVAFSGVRLAYDLACCRQYCADHPRVHWVPHTELPSFWSSTLPTYQDVALFEPHDHDLDRWWVQWQKKHPRVRVTRHPSPLFLLNEADWRELPRRKRPLLYDFYRRVRQCLGVLIDADGQPTGGRWSFDEENRAAYHGNPNDLPSRPTLSATDRRCLQQAWVDRRKDPAFTDARRVWCATPEFLFPVSRRGALAQLRHFVKVRLPLFGRYQDAMVEGDTTRLFHSLLSPLLNRGLLLPTEVMRAVLQASDVPLASREGFLRQLLGWREYALYVYRQLPPLSAAEWQRGRQLAPVWYMSTTGLAPLDDCLRRYWRSGYAHHIERLMLVGNMMLLCDVAPEAAYRWFMEISLDSFPWVMDLNVCMILFRKGVTTKPYGSSSRYLRKQSNYPPGAWTDDWDSLYTAWIWRYRDAWMRVRNMPFMVRAVERMDSSERQRRLRHAREVQQRLTL